VSVADPTRRYLIAGAGGMLGGALQRVLTERGVPFTAPAESDFDITDPAGIDRVVATFATDCLTTPERCVLVNAAAFTNVERAEDDALIAYRVNAHGARMLAIAARNAGLTFVHVSTDFVFDGAKDGAYVESDPVHPLSVYGASKLAGELAVTEADPDAIIARTAWVFGENGVNFPVKILELAASRPKLSVVIDEIGSPTYTYDLATAIVGLVGARAQGLFHLAGSGACSRFELAAEVLRLAGLDTELEPVTSDAFPTKAARPANSVLDCSKAAALGVTMPEWHDSLARFMAGWRAQTR
jgi:dTDP-4-dehydrorhamnose reductase